jgi:hypothetical protein
MLTEQQVGCRSRVSRQGPTACKQRHVVHDLVGGLRLPPGPRGALRAQTSRDSWCLLRNRSQACEARVGALRPSPPPPHAAATTTLRLCEDRRAARWPCTGVDTAIGLSEAGGSVPAACRHAVALDPAARERQSTRVAAVCALGRKPRPICSPHAVGHHTWSWRRGRRLVWLETKAKGVLQQSAVGRVDNRTQGMAVKRMAAPILNTSVLHGMSQLFASDQGWTRGTQSHVDGAAPCPSLSPKTSGVQQRCGGARCAAKVMISLYVDDKAAGRSREVGAARTGARDVRPSSRADLASDPAASRALPPLQHWLALYKRCIGSLLEGPASRSTQQHAAGAGG